MADWRMRFRIYNAGQRPLINTGSHLSWGDWEKRPMQTILPGQSAEACVVTGPGLSSGYQFDVTYAYNETQHAKFLYDIPKYDDNSSNCECNGINTDFWPSGQLPPDGHEFTKEVTVSDVPLTVIDTENWMAQMEKQLGNFLLSELLIPGSHDSATYALDNSSPIKMAGDNPSLDQATIDKINEVGSIINGSLEASILDDLTGNLFHDYFGPVENLTNPAIFPNQFIRGYAVAQTETIYNQLNLGARYIDMRTVVDQKEIDVNTYRTTFSGCHGVLGPPAESMLDQIAQFAVEHPQEILIVDFNHFQFNKAPQKEPADPDDMFHAKLFELIKAKLGDYMLIRMEQESPLTFLRTMGELWKAIDNNQQQGEPCRNILLIYRNQTIAAEEYVWGNGDELHNCYAGAQFASENINYLTNKFKYLPADRPLGQLYVTQLQLSFPEGSKILLFIFKIIADLPHAFSNGRSNYYIDVPLSLADMDRASIDLMLNWLDNFPHKNQANIVLMDRVNAGNCQRIIQLNQNLFGTSDHRIPDVHFFTNPKADKKVPMKLWSYPLGKAGAAITDSLINVNLNGSATTPGWGNTFAVAPGGRWLYLCVDREATTPGKPYQNGTFHIASLDPIDVHDHEGHSKFPSPGVMTITSTGKYLVFPGMQKVKGVLLDAKTLKELGKDTDPQQSGLNFDECIGLEISVDNKYAFAVGITGDTWYLRCVEIAFEAGRDDHNKPVLGKYKKVWEYNLKEKFGTFEPSCLELSQDGKKLYVFGSAGADARALLLMLNNQGKTVSRFEDRKFDDSAFRPNVAVSCCNGSKLLLSNTAPTGEPYLYLWDLRDNKYWGSGAREFTKSKLTRSLLAMAKASDDDTLVTLQKKDGVSKLVTYNIDSLLAAFNPKVLAGADIPTTVETVNIALAADNDREAVVDSLIVIPPPRYFKIVDVKTRKFFTAAPAGGDIPNSVRFYLADESVGSGSLTDGQCWYVEKLTDFRHRLINKAHVNNGALDCIYFNSVHANTFFFSDWMEGGFQSYDLLPAKDPATGMECFKLYNNRFNALLCTNGTDLLMVKGDEEEAKKANYSFLFYKELV